MSRPYACAEVSSAALAVLLLVTCAGQALAQREPWSHRLRGSRLARELHSADLEQREAAARELTTSGDPVRARLALIDALNTERSARVRAAIADSLAFHGDVAAVPALIQAFDSSRERDGPAIARALAMIGERDGLRALVDALARPDLAAAAIEGLRAAGPPAVPHLVRALMREPTELTVIELLGALGDPHALPRLTELAASSVPQTRFAAIEALGRLGDSRARETVLTALSDPTPEVRVAARVALGRVGAPADAEVLLASLESADVTEQRTILESALALDPERAAEAIVAAVTSDDALAVRVAGDVALEHPSLALVPVLYGLLEEGSRIDEAASALAEVEAGAGVPVLLREASRPAAHRALAVAARRWADRLPLSLRRRIWEVLRARDSDDSDAIYALSLRALALDPEARGPLLGCLEGRSALERGWCANALGLLGDRATVDALVRRLASELDEEAWRRVARALEDLEARLEPELLPYLTARLDTASMAPEAVALLPFLNIESRREREIVGRELRRSLRHREGRVRAAAAAALGRLGDRTAWRALLGRVESDDQTEVRHAAARALLTLGSPAAQGRLAASSRIERDPDLAALLREAASLAPRRLAAPRGRRVLRFRVAAATSTAGVVLDLVLPGARWLRIRTLPSGEIFVPDLPAGQADVRVRIDGR